MILTVKTEEELGVLKEGGKHLAQIKENLKASIGAGVSGKELDKKAEELIREAGGEPSFKRVPNYHWATCINVDDGVVHGIPNGKPFREGNLVSLDVGMFYKGFHTDTSFTVGIGELNPEKRRFLEAGERALKAAIQAARAGNHIGHISLAMQKVLEGEELSPVRALTGHGIGRSLHEEPQIPCFWEGDPASSPKIPAGAVLAIEVIYTEGSSELIVDSDKWTIRTRDGKIAGLFEETVASLAQGPLVLTESDSVLTT